MTHTKFMEALIEAGLCEQAAIAVTAATNETRWGKDAAVKFAVARGCPMRLVKLAMALERDVSEVLYH